MATVSSGAVPPEVVWAHAAGAPSNGVDDDTPVVQALLDANKLVMFEPGRLFRFYTKLELSSMARLRSLGPGNSDGLQVTSSAKLVFTGSGSGCFVSKNPNNYLSHGGFNDLTVRAEGPYLAVFDLPNCVEMTWQNCTIETNNVNTGGIRGGKLPGLNAWINRIIACNWRLPDAGTSWVYDVNWSDSEVVASHFTGGLGSIDRGFGVSYIANQFERARYRGLRISKEYEAKQGNIIGNRFDANADVGLEIFVDDDASTQTRIALSIVGNQFRTVSPTNPGVLGQADIRYTSKFTDRTYSILPPIASVYTAGLTTHVQRDPAKFSSAFTVDGDIGTQLAGTLIDQNGLLFPRGLGYAITAHSQSPEGRISAVPGSLCMTPLGMYSKITGSGNTGWKKLAIEP